MKKLFKTVRKNGKTYKVNKVGVWICTNCLGVDRHEDNCSVNTPTDSMERASKLNIKYPKVREILDMFYSVMYNQFSLKSEGDGADGSTYYPEIEKIIEQEKAVAHHAGVEEERERVKSKVGWLRQWLNEKPKDMLVTNEQIEEWLDLKDKPL